MKRRSFLKKAAVAVAAAAVVPELIAQVPKPRLKDRLTFDPEDRRLWTVGTRVRIYSGGGRYVEGVITHALEGGGHAIDIGGR